MQLQKIAQIALEIVENTQSEYAIALYRHLEAGKMLRSKLVLSIVDNDEAYRLCAIIELIQSASLLHDDVIDSSELRRGKPSLNAEFGNKRAIMLGDILYSSAFYELSKFSPLIAQSLSKSVACLSVGELEDVQLEAFFNDNEEKYLHMIQNKSASLIAASAQCAALLSGQENHQAYYDYGLGLGMAFQIIDDILDITQDAKHLGKPALSDYRSGKTTLPYIYLYNSLDEEQREWLKGMFKQDLSKEEEQKLLGLLLNGPIVEAKIKALYYGNFALMKAKEVGNKQLQSIIADMIERDY